VLLSDSGLLDTYTPSSSVSESTSTRGARWLARRLLRLGSSQSSSESVEEQLVLAVRRLLVLLADVDTRDFVFLKDGFDRNSSSSGVSPLRILASTALSPTNLPSEPASRVDAVLLDAALTMLALLVTGTLPSITFAGGGG
jgi:hypothetical protein